MTELWLKVGANLTIAGGGTTPLDDFWDRAIASLSLVYGSTGYFNFSDMTLAHHLMRFQGMATPRLAIPTTATSTTFYTWYRLHFGTVPYQMDKVTGRWKANEFDLSGAVPQLPAQSLSLTGTWGGSTSYAASGVTVNSLTLQPYFTYISNKENESAADFQPQAFPNWISENDSAMITTGTLPLPVSDYVQAVLFATRTGTPALRSDAVLTSLKFRDQSGSRDIFSFGAWSDATAMTQQARNGADDGHPASDSISGTTYAYVPGSVGVAGTVFGSTFIQPSNPGLAYFDMRDWISEPDPYLGLNMDPAVNPFSQLVWQYGSNTSASNALALLYKKYKKNQSATPQVAGLHPAVASAMAAAGR
jgi:hypothetical protein